MNPFTPEQSERIKGQLETQPCLYNARHYLTNAAHRDHSLLTMACWLNEVGGKEIATPEIVAEILGIPGPGAKAEEAPAGPVPDVWADVRADLGDALA